MPTKNRYASLSAGFRVYVFGRRHVPLTWPPMAIFGGVPGMVWQEGGNGAVLVAQQVAFCCGCQGRPCQNKLVLRAGRSNGLLSQRHDCRLAWPCGDKLRHNVTSSLSKDVMNEIGPNRTEGINARGNGNITGRRARRDSRHLHSLSILGSMISAAVDLAGFDLAAPICSGPHHSSRCHPVRDHDCEKFEASPGPLHIADHCD